MLNGVLDYLPLSAMSLPSSAMSVPVSAAYLPSSANVPPRFAIMILRICAVGAGFSVIVTSNAYLSSSLLFLFSLVDDFLRNSRDATLSCLSKEKVTKRKDSLTTCAPRCLAASAACCVE